MSLIVESDVADYLGRELKYNPRDRQTIVEQIRDRARAVGHDVDERFAEAGMSAGPEGRVASHVVSRAMGRSGCGVTEREIRRQANAWLLNGPERRD